MAVGRRIDLREFDLESRNDIVVLVNKSKTVGLLHEKYFDDYMERHGLEQVYRFRLETSPVEERLLCIDKTCWDLDVLEEYDIYWSEIYAGKDKPLLAKIKGSNWYLLLAPISR